MSHTKLIIFDLDGVLVDACEWHRLALNKALKEVIDYEISDVQHEKTFNGIPTKVKLEVLTQMGVLRTEQHQLVYDKKQSYTVDMISEYGKIRHEKVDLIKYLKDQNIIVACYTNSIRKTAKLMLERTGVYELLDYVLTNQDVAAPKPDAEGYNFLVNHFGVNTDECVIVEDSPKGKKAAYASGCRVIEVDDPSFVNIEFLKDKI